MSLHDFPRHTLAGYQRTDRSLAGQPAATQDLVRGDLRLRSRSSPFYRLCPGNPWRLSLVLCPAPLNASVYSYSHRDPLVGNVQCHTSSGHSLLAGVCCMLATTRLIPKESRSAFKKLAITFTAPSLSPDGRLRQGLLINWFHDTLYLPRKCLQAIEYVLTPKATSLCTMADILRYQRSGAASSVLWARMVKYMLESPLTVTLTVCVVPYKQDPTHRRHLFLIGRYSQWVSL